MLLQLLSYGSTSLSSFGILEPAAVKPGGVVDEKVVEMVILSLYDVKSEIPLSGMDADADAELVCWVSC